MKDRLAAWALRHAYTKDNASGEGSLVYIGPDGSVRDLGALRPKDLEGLGWAVGVAYRTSRERWERTRLAALRPIARHVVAQARAIRLDEAGQADPKAKG